MKNIFIILTFAILVQENLSLGLRDSIQESDLPDYYHPKTYQINMDLEPEDRWKEFITDTTPQIKKLIRDAELFLPLDFLNLTPINWIDHYQEEPLKEMQAVSKISGIDIQKIFWINLMMELFTFCTSIVAQDCKNNILHARNLDWWLPNDMRAISFNGEIYQNGTLQYRANLLAGMVGFITGEKPGVFAISANNRADSTKMEDHPFDHPIHDVEAFIRNAIEIFKSHRPSIPWVIREALKNSKSYDEAVTYLAETKLITSTFYIVSGVKPGEGCVLALTKDDLYGKYSLDADNGIWYLVQTNYDRDQKEPKDDPRRSVGEVLMNKIGRENITIDNILSEVLTVPPILNDATMLTVLEPSAQDMFNIYIWKE